MTYLLTRESVRAAQACYSDSKIDEIVPSEGLTPRQVAELNIPLADIVWALVCACNLPLRQVVFFAQNCVGAETVDASAHAAADARATRAYATRAAARAATRAAADAAADARATRAYAAAARAANAADRAAAARAATHREQIAELLRMFEEIEA